MQTIRTTKEEVEEEVNLMQKEAEMSLEELKAMYTRMEENTNDKHDESDKVVEMRIKHRNQTIIATITERPKRTLTLAHS